MTAFYCTIDDDGFLRGNIRADMVNSYNRHIVVETPLPNDSLADFERWRWVTGVWIKVADLRGHSWYDPLDTTRVHSAKSFDDAPPVGWAYWAPGENPVVTQNEALRREWKQVRKRRNTLLSETDWVVVRAADRGETVPQAWRLYRQALREITSQPDPFNITWPQPPA